MSANTADLKQAMETIAQLVPNLKAKTDRTVTWEKKVSKVTPWVWLGVGGALILVGAVWLTVAAAHGLPTPGLTIGLVFIGGTMVGIGGYLHKRAEDWDNWRSPAQQIAETHIQVQRNDESIGRLEKQQEAIEIDRVRREHRLMDMLEECSERQNAAISAVLRAVTEDAKANGHHETEARDESDPPGEGTAGVIALPNTRVYQLGIEEGLRRARGRRDERPPN